MLYVVLDCHQAAVTDTAHGTVQGSLIDFWLAWPVGSMINSKQSFAEPVQLVQMHASQTVSSVFLPNMPTVKWLIRLAERLCCN